VLVSQVVTQRDAHLHNPGDVAAFREAFLAQRRRCSWSAAPVDELATEDLGVDRIFGRGPPPRSRATRPRAQHPKAA
jgi:beta-lysine 5,6-aminomutase beta subunit